MQELNVLDKTQAQNRLSKFFDSFREEKIQGVSFNLMPPKTEVPLIKQVAYDKTKDVFEIVFEYQSEVVKKKQGVISFIEDNQGRLVGIQIYDVKKNDINKITLEIIANLDEVIQNARVSLEQKVSFRDVAKLDLEERKAEFFKEIVEKHLSELVK
jgi:hypothetical protein